MKSSFLKIAISFGTIVFFYLVLLLFFRPEPSIDIISSYIHLPILNSNLIFVPNLLFIILSVYLFSSSLTKSIKNYLLVTIIFSLSPFLWQAVFTSPAQSIIIFLVSLCLFFKKSKYFFIPFLTSLLIIGVSLTSSLNPMRYRFENDIHRQSELNAGVPFLGKILYNKYLSAPGTVLKNAMSKLDWDRGFFISYSGKSENRPFDKLQFTFLELPILVFALIKYKKYALKIILLLIASALYSTDSHTALDPSIFVWMLFSALIFKILPRIPLFILLPIFFGRLIYLNLDMQNNLGFPRTVSAYLEVTSDINKFSDKKVYFTDRLGQPHLYLTYLGLIPPNDLSASISINTPRDKDGRYQPSIIGRFYFGSFNTDNLLKTIIDNPDTIIIESSKSFPEDPINQIDIQKTYHFSNLIMVKTKALKTR